MAPARPSRSSTPTPRRRSNPTSTRGLRPAAFPPSSRTSSCRSSRRGYTTRTSATANQLVVVVQPGIYNKPQSNAQDPQGWYGEETLDVEAVHAMAPGAKIVYAGAKSFFALLIDMARNNMRAHAVA